MVLAKYRADDDEDWEPLSWDDAEALEEAAKTGEPNPLTRRPIAHEAERGIDAGAGIVAIASALDRRYYSRASQNARWPDDFHSKKKTMSSEDRKLAGRVQFALMVALTTQLIGALSALEFKIMLFIVNRTWAWGKPREGIPASQFMDGAFIKGKQIQAPIAKSSDHLHEAWEGLNRKGLIRIDTAPCKYGYVKVYEIGVGEVLRTADEIQRTTRKPLPRREKLRNSYRGY